MLFLFWLEVIDNSFHVISIQLIACVKALQILDVEQRVSDETKKTIKVIKELIGSHSNKDKPFYTDLQLVENFIRG